MSGYTSQRRVNDSGAVSTGTGRSINLRSALLSPRSRSGLGMSLPW